MQTVQEQQGIWSVPLGAAHAAYPVINLRRNYPASHRYTVVIVAPGPLMRAFARDAGFVIPPARQWPADQLAQMRAYLAPRPGGQPVVEMPLAHIELRREALLYGLLGSRLVPVVAFTNGRHRARYLQYAGAPAFPVEVDLTQAPLMQQYCGA